ncbi:MAG: hypothetical protein COU71_01310 [Parcubacteria group bacterium CG10_big_fil_rev_8_21_14_0_10_38_31]|nr:MAG: hypothetical protein COU71_01310 [Parcubacteria group bacterium CG10_big_fil_rev_8_21_14_0_10_38_31]
MLRREALASSRKIKRKRLTLKLSLYLLAIICLFSVFVSFFYIPKFKIKEIEINGISSDNKDKLSNKFSVVMVDKYLGIFPYNNIFIFPEGKLKADVLSEYPDIKEIDFKNFFPGKVLTTASERDLFAVWCFKEGDCSFVDEDGFIFKSAPVFYGNIFLKFFDERRGSSSDGLDKGKQALDKNDFDKLVDFINFTASKNILIYKIFIRDEGVYDLETILGWHILLNKENNPEEAFQNLRIILDSQIKEDYVDKIGYIDLRFGNKIFYKFNDE